MAPVELLDVRPGDKVLDLCAAPGGKSTQIAAKLQGQGLLVSNDNQAERVKALVKNLAVSGVRNAIVTNETPERLARAFPGYFDKILIDAPCSGEGMFRKDDDMVASWESHSTMRCAAMQREILDAAAKLLAPGGRIVYSTCTFAPEENEAQVARFLDANPEFEVLSAAPSGLFDPGRPEWIAGPVWTVGKTFTPSSASQVAGAYRLWPHRIRGEGHFAAVLQHRGNKENARDAQAAPQRTAGLHELGSWREFMDSQLVAPIDGSWVTFGDRVFWTNWQLPDLSGLQVARPGWFVGTMKKNRFEPSQALAMGLSMQQARRTVHLKSSEPETLRYLKGETLMLPDDRLVTSGDDTPAKGYVLVGVDGFPLGWAKWQNGMLKNEYPAGWRWT